MTCYQVLKQPSAYVHTCNILTGRAWILHKAEESGSYFPSPWSNPLLSRHIDRSLWGPEALTEPRCSQSVWGDWGDWCHGVPEPLKCRLSVNMTKARPALSPGWDTLLTMPTTMLRSHRLIYTGTHAHTHTPPQAPVLKQCMAVHQPFLIRERPPDQHWSSKGYNDTLIQG